MNGAKLDHAAAQGAGQRRTLWPGIGKIELFRDATAEQVDMLGQHDARLHDMQVVQPPRIGGGEGARQEIRLLLVVTLDADAVERPHDGFEQGGRVPGGENLALGMAGCRIEPRRAILSAAIPGGARAVQSDGVSPFFVQSPARGPAAVNMAPGRRGRRSAAAAPRYRYRFAEGLIYVVNDCNGILLSVSNETSGRVRDKCRSPEANGPPDVQGGLRWVSPCPWMTTRPLRIR